MSKMNTPKMEVILFKADDVIATSALSALKTFTLSGVSDDVAHNATIVLNDNSYTYVNDGQQTKSELYSSLSDYFGVTVSGTTSLARPNLTSSNFSTVLNSDDNGTSKSYNGTYYWNGSAFSRQ